MQPTDTSRPVMWRPRAVAHRRLPHTVDTPRWHAPAALATDAVGVYGPVLTVYHLADEPRPFLAAAAAAAAWIAIRAGHGRYTRGTLGESRGLVAAVHDWSVLIGVLAVLRVLTGESAALLTALTALSPALVLTGTAGALLHAHLNAQHRQAHAVRRVLVIGEPRPAGAVAAQLAARTDHAYVVVGAVPVGWAPLPGGVPESGRLEPGAPERDGEVVLGAARRRSADLVLVVPGTRLTGERLRRLSWSLQDAGLPLAVASGLTEVALRRLRISTAAGLNLLHVSPPLRGGPQLLCKSLLDRAAAALGLVLLTPLLALIALGVRLDSKGPVLYRQQRVGHRGAPFTMWKFRTMVADAERLRPRLEGTNEAAGPLFKVRRDPRVTRIGRLLRRTSLDELPQLVNVVRGQMSLVGPRPSLPAEVAQYTHAERRRLQVKPGMTGPWQVSGRSELSWDESVALDLSYTDNWSVTGDLDVLARTLRAVAVGRGAY